MNTQIELTRVYKIRNTGEVKQGSVTVEKMAVVSVVASNRLGRDNGHRSTITLINGVTFDLADKYSEVKEMLR